MFLAALAREAEWVLEKGIAATKPAVCLTAFETHQAAIDDFLAHSPGLQAEEVAVFAVVGHWYSRTKAVEGVFAIKARHLRPMFLRLCDARSEHIPRLPLHRIGREIGAIPEEMREGETMRTSRTQEVEALPTPEVADEPGANAMLMCRVAAALESTPPEGTDLAAAGSQLVRRISTASAAVSAKEEAAPAPDVELLDASWGEVSEIKRERSTPCDLGMLDAQWAGELRSFCLLEHQHSVGSEVLVPVPLLRFKPQGPEGTAAKHRPLTHAVWSTVTALWSGSLAPSALQLEVGIQDGKIFGLVHHRTAALRVYQALTWHRLLWAKCKVCDFRASESGRPQASIPPIVVPTRRREDGPRSPEGKKALSTRASTSTELKRSSCSQAFSSLACRTRPCEVCRQRIATCHRTGAEVERPRGRVEPREKGLLSGRPRHQVAERGVKVQAEGAHRSSVEFAGKVVEEPSATGGCISASHRSVGSGFSVISARTEQPAPTARFQTRSQSKRVLPTLLGHTSTVPGRKTAPPKTCSRHLPWTGLTKQSAQDAAVRDDAQAKIDCATMEQSAPFVDRLQM